MPDEPTTRAYRPPDGAAISLAAGEAIDAVTREQNRLGRVIAVVTAAAFCDALTGCDPDAPFDAAAAEMAEGADGSLFATGRYWTAAGEERLLTDHDGGHNAVFDINEWAPYLNEDNRSVWRPLCTALPEDDGRPMWRMDLVRAAALPLT